jgi:type IV pilus assembly protein PilO
VNAEILGILRQRKVLIAAAVGLLVLLIWLVAIFVPEGHKLAAVNAKVQAAQTQQVELQARLTRLRAYSKQSAEFEALSQRLTAAVPPTTDVYDYITAISNAASGTGMQVTNVDPAIPVSSSGVAVVPVTVSAAGTYDQTLAFLKALYSLPRLTVISGVSITGGGTGTSRSTKLNDQFTLSIFAQPSALVGQTPTVGG